MPPKTSLWPLESHTVGKHRVLRHYMEAWLPIMMRNNSRILFIDAFAGPGQYSGGEDGSPVIALETFLEHNSRHMMTGEVRYVFIEKEVDRAQHLEQVVGLMKSNLPMNCHVHVFQGTFTDKMTEVLDTIDAQNRRLAPAFVMVDPFGVSDTPMSLIARILTNPKSEVYVSFMYEAINRFKTTSAFSSPTG